jgi:hypothetical protein
MIKFPIRFEGSKGEKVLYGLFDTRAKFSYIRPDRAKVIAEPQPLFRPLEIATADAGRHI